ncbi:hypothetical protein T4B_14753 [Trichinella pseudospiralis]|uniref:Uncharacterized protein n=1 Tax=Trichinella pseudospiralis TaxID=6337 RepID=A0A0V1GHI7_TRIPS|nr:hypothetical protein T4A_9643 [Trichinella pseudospiralis]KRY97251.1 hypothetical protein T4B_14753 [Trichinella pseudospiralis]
MLIHYEDVSFLKISRDTFFDYYICILINYCILESLSERNSVVVE